MPTTETTNRRLLKIASGSTEDWSVHYNATIDLLDRPVIDYRITAAENLAAGEVAVIKDDGAGAKKAYLAASGAVTMGDPLGVATETVLAGSPVRLTLSGAVTNLAWAFGPTDATAYLSSTGTVTMTDTGFPLGPVIGIDTFYLGASSGGNGGGGQTNSVTGSSGITNTGTNVDAVLAPTYGSTAGTVCEGNDVRLHAQNSDLGTSATSFEINYLGASARLLTSNLTGNRDITFPDATTALLGAANNLSDVASAATARTNLGLGNAATLDTGTGAGTVATGDHLHVGVYEPVGAANPVGAIIIFGAATPPTGYLECDGSAVSRTTYAALFSAIGVAWGSGDGSTTFNLPDLRGRFLRGWDHGAGRDPAAASRTASATGGATGDNVGSVQADEIKSHTHSTLTGSNNWAAYAVTNLFNLSGAGVTGETGGNETRPVNAALLFAIKY